MGHVGQECGLGGTGKSGLTERIFKNLFLLHLVAYFVVYSAGAHDDPGDGRSLAYTGNAKLQALDLSVHIDPKVDIKACIVSQLLFDIGRGD